MVDVAWTPLADEKGLAQAERKLGEHPALIQADVDLEHGDQNVDDRLVYNVSKKEDVVLNAHHCQPEREDVE